MKEKIGKRIRELRVEQGHSQEIMAEKLHISRSAYERIENGKSNSWANHLEGLSKVFEVSPDYFLKEDNNTLQDENQSGGLEVQSNREIKTPNSLPEKLFEEFIEF